MRPKITRTYEMPAPSGVKVVYTESTRGVTISNGITSVWLDLDFIPSLAEALKSIRQVHAKEAVDKPNGQHDD